MNNTLAPVARNFVTHSPIFGVDSAKLATYRNEGIEFGGATVQVDARPELWTTAVLGDHYQSVGLSQGRALQIADGHVAVLKNMSADRFAVKGDAVTGFNVGHREFASKAGAERHLKQLRAVMALDALTGGLYFGALSERGVVTYTDRQRNLFFSRGAQVIERHLTAEMQPGKRSNLGEHISRLSFEKWFWDLGTKEHDPLEAILRDGATESPLFWGIMFRARFMDRAHVERVNPRLKAMLGIIPRTY